MHMHALVGPAALAYFTLTTSRAFVLLWFEIIVGVALAGFVAAGVTCDACGATLGLASCAQWDDVVLTTVDVSVALAVVAPLACRLDVFNALAVRCLIAVAMVWMRVDGRSGPVSAVVVPSALLAAAVVLYVDVRWPALRRGACVRASRGAHAAWASAALAASVVLLTVLSRVRVVSVAAQESVLSGVARAAVVFGGFLVVFLTSGESGSYGGWWRTDGLLAGRVHHRLVDLTHGAEEGNLW